MMQVSCLFPIIPYDFHLSAMIFSEGDPQIRTCEKGIFRQVLDIGGTLVLVEVFSKGTVDAPELCFTIRPDDALSEHMRTVVSGIISSMFNINEDIGPFCHEMQKDPVMASLIRQLPGVKIPTTPTIFEALVDSVIEQQISLKAAHSIEKRLIRATGRTLPIQDLVYFSYPTPDALADTADMTFRACGLTRRKGEYIRGISQDILSGALDLEILRIYTDTEAVISRAHEGSRCWEVDRGVYDPEGIASS